MKCPVCGKENTSMLCVDCGFDSSRDYGSYPTFAPVGVVKPASALRRELTEGAAEKKLRKKHPRGFAAICAVILAAGIWIGTGLGGDTAQPIPPQEALEPWRQNVLRSDIPPAREDGVIYNVDAIDHTVFGSEYKRDRIETITFLDTLKDAPEDAWDVSEAGDGSVLAWVEDRWWWKYDLYIGAEGGVSAGESCLGMFAGYNNVSRITFGDAFHTDRTKDMGIMFWWCDDLTQLDLSNWNTGNVQRMNDMFSCCRTLRSLDLSDWNTGSVQDMSAMFVGCWGLKTLNLKGFDTRSVQDMHNMFSDCRNLWWLNLSGFDMSNVENTANMFEGCELLENLDLKNFDMANVQDTTDMFLNCPAGEEWGHLLK